MAKNTVRVNVVGDASSFNRSMGEAGRTTETTGKKMSTFAKVAVAALAVKALDAVQTFVRGSHEAFVNLQESLNAVEVTYGKNAEGIKKLGREAANAVGLSNAEFNTFAVSMSAFAEQIAGDGGDVVGVVDNMTRRIADFASVMNLEVNVAAEKFQSGLAGQSRPLREFGIDVSDARVKVFAYANGIAKAGEEMTEAQKVQARYGTIMEQTDKVTGDFQNTIDDFANAQRVANAEMENSKAVMGESFDIIAKAGLPVMSQMAESAAVIAISLQGLTGQLNKQQVAIKQYELQMGKSADTAEDVITIWAEWGVAVKDLLPLLDLSTEELIRLRDADEDFLKSLGWTEEGIRGVAEAIDKEFAKKMDQGADAVLRGKDATDELAGSMEDLEEETEDATTALENFESEVRSQVDPLFAYRQATKKATEAQAAATAARDKFGAGSPEHVDALLDVAEAGYDLEASLIKVAEQSNLTRAQFQTQLQQMGVFTDQEIQDILDEFQRINAFKFSDKSIAINTTGSGSGLVPKVYAKAEGGPVKRNSPYVVGEEGPELFVPGQSGTIIPNGAANTGAGMSGGSLIVNVYGTVLTPTDLVDAIHEGLLQKQKRNGGLGLAG